MADATTSLELLLLAKDQASKVLDDVKEKAGGMGKALGDVAKIAGGFVVAEGITKLGGFLVDAAKGAAEDQAATDRLNQSLGNFLDRNTSLVKGTSDYSDALAEMKTDMEDRIKAGQKLAFSDDDVRDSMQALLAATDDVQVATDRHKAAMDLARGANIPLATATKMLGKINEENVDVFKKMGIELGKNATEADALAAVQARFGGQAEAYAKSTAGQFEQAKIRMSEMKETIGAAVLPVMTALMTFLVSTVIPGMEQFANLVGPILKGAFDIVAPVIKAFIDYLKFTVTEGDKMNDFLMNVPEPLRGVATAMAEVALFIKNDLIPAIEQVIAVVKDHWPEIQTVIAFAADFVKAQIEGMIQVIQGIIEVVTGVIDLVSALWHGEWAEAWEAMKQIAEGVLDIFIGNLKRMFGNLPEIIVELAVQLAQKGYDAGKALADGIINGIGNLASRVAEKVSVAGVSLGDVGRFVGGLPGFDDGGIVPGRIGEPRIIMAHGGETILPTHKGGAASGTVNVTIGTVIATDAAAGGRLGNDIGWAISLRRRGFAA